MREGPILFQGDMVSAILEDQKSMTRRVIKPQPVLSPNAGFGQYHHGQMWTYGTYSNGVSNVRNFVASRSPYGQPGDLLWVRETWYDDMVLRETIPTAPDEYIFYRADGEAFQQFEALDDSNPFAWRASIHMPRWASRITLRVTDVRVEQVQDISTANQMAEGLRTHLREHDAVCDLREQWVGLWDSINAKPKRSSHNPYTGVLEHCYVSYPWENVTETLEHNKFPWYVIGNPWVWVVSFERLK